MESLKNPEGAATADTFGSRAYAAKVIRDNGRWCRIDQDGDLLLSRDADPTNWQCWFQRAVDRVNRILKAARTLGLKVYIEEVAA